MEWNGGMEYGIKRQTVKSLKDTCFDLFSLNHSLELTSTSIGRISQRSLISGGSRISK